MDVSGLFLRDRRAAARLRVVVQRLLRRRQEEGIRLRHRLLTLTLKRVA
jgi:hypothetical protein